MQLLCKDHLLEQYTQVTYKGLVAQATPYLSKGKSCKTFIELNELCKYNSIDTYNCTFGADTTISFQYSMVVTLTDYVEVYAKNCKEKSDAGKGKGKVLSSMNINIDAVSRLYTLASYGWKVEQRRNNTYVLTTPYYKKLPSFRRIMDGNTDFFNLEYISVNRYDNKDLLETIKINHADIIKECQKSDRHFVIHWISDRIDKAWN